MHSDREKTNFLLLDIVRKRLYRSWLIMITQIMHCKYKLGLQSPMTGNPQSIIRIAGRKSRPIENWHHRFFSLGLIKLIIIMIEIGYDSFHRGYHQSIDTNFVEKDTCGIYWRGIIIRTCPRVASGNCRIMKNKKKTSKYMRNIQ